MNYIDYINYLKSNNIILFDHDYRISYNNIINYMKNNKNNMTGGGFFLSKYNNNELNMIVSIATSMNPQYLLSFN